MDCTFAIQGPDYVLLAADKAVCHSIIKIQDTDNKITRLNESQLLSTVGENYDRKSFSKLVQCNLEYYYYLNNHRLNTNEVASYVRSLYAEGIRSHPHQCNALVCGYDLDGPKLFWGDYLGAMEQVTRGAHGYGGYYLYGLMDNYYKKDMTLEDGEKCIAACIKELKTRFIINMVDFTVYKITKNGIEEISAKFNPVKEKI